ncbi:hypothetical protein [Phytohabitans kaempferiae]|uniref:Uncharacterized protein n=1 Tax=Phytohabitans kaempferiae TaxID=1620943 RepID=A0ABV6M4C0_9ACTN
MDGLWEADFALRLATYGADGTDPTYAAGCLFRAVGVACHALHGRAHQWLINEKGMVASATGLSIAPPGFAERAQRLLGNIGQSPPQITQTTSHAHALLAEVRVAVAYPPH